MEVDGKAEGGEGVTEKETEMENVEVDAHAAWLLTPVESNHSVAESTTSIQFNSQALFIDLSRKKGCCHHRCERDSLSVSVSLCVCACAS